MAVEWSSNVNKNFYGADNSYKENTESVEFKSGRTIKYLKNSVSKKIHTVNLTCKDTGTNKINGMTEFEHFLYWYENETKSGTVPFNFKDLSGSNEIKQYLIKEVPTWSGQQYKEISLTLEEV